MAFRRSRVARRCLVSVPVVLMFAVAACSDDDSASPPATLRVTTAASGETTAATTTAATATGTGTSGPSSSASSSSAPGSSTTIATTPTTIKGSGTIVSRDYPLENFTGVDAASGFVVTITHAEIFHVTVKADDNVFDRLIVDVMDDHLRLGVAPNTTLQNVHLEATVTMPELESLETSGAVEATVNGFTSVVDRSVDASGASQVGVDASFAAKGLELTAGGGSQLTFAGRADEVTLELSGGSVLDGKALATGDFSAELSGGSEATITVNTSIDNVELSGGSRLTYSGSPRLGDVETSGGSTVEKG
jgi:hypothetical protein